MAKTEIDVTMELWKKAHDLESKAMDAGDSKGVKQAQTFKELLAGDILTDSEPKQAAAVVTSDAIHDGHTTEGYAPQPSNPLGKIMNKGGEQS